MNGIPYSPDEIEVIAYHWLKGTDVCEISKSVGRSIHSIRTHMSAMKIRRPVWYLSKIRGEI